MAHERLSRLQRRILAWLQAHEQRTRGTMAARYPELVQALGHEKGNLSHSLANLEAKGLVRMNVTDIFWTNLPRATITYNNYIEIWRAYRETRVANLSFTYRFGSSKVQQARRRTTGSEEERQRAQ